MKYLIDIPDLTTEREDKTPECWECPIHVNGEYEYCPILGRERKVYKKNIKHELVLDEVSCPLIPIIENNITNK